ncbi:DUF4365 domain-containing protein [Xenophilus arseniciresistens]|uniref:DUF4365 domain-containing protein n=1 Tax=Xenophilus arseniciresistens TaxID=1283306 RepID=A0AAE3N437_9BURK|nr:DUF4365 domain-containing protein [Xenophilus arseniciresistens]MDA7414886.1 DUF4365 domain-containing protein [Xenophilus arseniciresistens]
MDLPKAGRAYAQERLGIAALQMHAAKRGQIWRETGTGDVGIDGNLEFVTPEGFATGRIVGVQVKAGPSYFKHATAEGWKFYPEDKHKRYWESYPLPVLLVIHDPDSNKSYWTDARQVLRTPGTESAYIEIPRRNDLDETDVFALFRNAGLQEQPFISDLNEVLIVLLQTQSQEASFPLSYFDMFVQGLTNICRSLYYGMDLVTNAVEFNLAASEFEFGMGMGDTEHQFVFGFVKFLQAQNLAQIDYADCLIDWVDREMQPNFVAPLTQRGRKLVDLIFKKEARLVEQGMLPAGDGRHVAQEGFFGMAVESYYPRLPLIRAFQQAIKDEPHNLA